MRGGEGDEGVGERAEPMCLGASGVAGREGVDAMRITNVRGVEGSWYYNQPYREARVEVLALLGGRATPRCAACEAARVSDGGMARCAPRVVAVDIIDAVAHDGGAIRVEPVDGNGVRRELPDEALFADLVWVGVLSVGERVWANARSECAKRTREANARSECAKRMREANARSECVGVCGIRVVCECVKRECGSECAEHNLCTLRTSVWRRPDTWSHVGQPMKQPWLYQNELWPLSQAPPLMLEQGPNVCRSAAGTFANASTELRERGCTIDPWPRAGSESRARSAAQRRNFIPSPCRSLSTLAAPSLRCPRDPAALFVEIGYSRLTETICFSTNAQVCGASTFPLFSAELSCDLPPHLTCLCGLCCFERD